MKGSYLARLQIFSDYTPYVEKLALYGDGIWDSQIAEGKWTVKTSYPADGAMHRGCEEEYSMTYHKPISSKEGLELIAKIRKHCAQFPEVAEKIDLFGHTSFRISDKPFVILGGMESVLLSIKADKHMQEFLLQQADTNFRKTPYIGQHGWITVIDLERADWKELEELITEGYYRTAPKKYFQMLKRAEHNK